MKECNCCYKNCKTLTKCFVNNSCSWRSCNNCINKQIKFENGNQFVYKCPYCRKDSEYHKHCRFSKYVKQNRGALRKILQLQSNYIKYITSKLIHVHMLISQDMVFDPIYIEDDDESHHSDSDQTT